MSKIFRNQFNYSDTMSDLSGCAYERNNTPSKTVPDQTLPIEVLVTRAQRGQSVPSLEPVFDDELPDISRMDTLQKLDLAKQIQQNIADARRNMAKPDKVESILIDDVPTPTPTTES